MTKEQWNLVKIAIAENDRREAIAMENVPIVDFETSREFERNMLALKNGWVPKRKSQEGLGMRRRIALLIAAALIALMLSACAFIEPIRNFIIEIYDGGVAFFYSSADKEIIDEEYSPSWLPEGYSIVRHSKQKKVIENEYENGTNKIFFSQRLLSSGVIDIDNDGELKTVVVNETEVNYVESEGTYIFIWFDEPYYFILQCSDDIPISDVQKIISSTSES